jgi:acylglycerol lipase
MRPSLLALGLLAAGCATAGPSHIHLEPRALDASGAAHQELVVAGQGGLQLFGQRWSPADGKTRAVLVVVHGLKDHSGRYAELADAAVASGFDVWAYDQRGHGRSAGEREVIESFDDYLADLDLFLAKLRVAAPGKPIFLFAHSMGGCVATLYTLRHHPALAGLLLSGPAIEPTDDVSLPLRGATHVLGAIAPGAKVFELPTEKQSRDPQTIATADADPLVTHGNAPAHTAAELLSAMGDIRERWGELDVPLLAMHGTADLLTNPKGSQDLVAHARSADKTLKLYPGLFHDLLHDPERAQVRSDIVAWLDAHAPR